MLVFPNAKINLGLNIVAKRPDGYHDIETVMVPIGWCDSLEIVPASGDETTLEILGRKVDCPVENNLVMKAYRAMEREFRLPSVHIYLYKAIPDGAGLGGGSADAAFTLKALNDMFALGADDDRLAGIAATLGADCPFFIYNRPMMAVETGTTLASFNLNLSGHTILVAKIPGTEVSTAAAYSAVVPRAAEYDLQECLTRPVADWNGIVKNDFEAGIFAAKPQVAALKAEIIEAGAEYAAMSGSGSAVFGIFDDDILAENAQNSLKAKGYDTYVGPL